MGVSRGRIQTLEISNDGVTYFPITKLIDATLALDSSDINVTTHDSGQWEEMLQGRSKWSIDCKVRHDESDANGQAQAITGFFAQTVFFWRFRTKGALTGNFQYVGNGYVKNQPIVAGNDADVQVSFTVQGTAALTKSTQ